MNRESADKRSLRQMFAVFIVIEGLTNLIPAVTGMVVGTALYTGLSLTGYAETTSVTWSSLVLALTLVVVYTILRVPLRPLMVRAAWRLTSRRSRRSRRGNRRRDVQRDLISALRAH